MLLGRSKDAQALAPGAPISSEPLSARRYLREAQGDVSYMGWFLATILPRLGTATVSSSDDWGVVVRASNYANLIGSRYMSNLIAWFAATHADKAESSYDRLACLLARLPSGDVKLHTVYPYLASSGHTGHFAASKLASAAFRQGDLRSLDAAIERLKYSTEESAEYCDPRMELLIAQACREFMVDGNLALFELFECLKTLAPEWRRNYELDVCQQFLSSTDSQTIGMLVQGFGLLSSLPADVVNRGQS